MSEETTTPELDGIIDFLSIRDVDYSDIEKHLVHKLSSLLQCFVKCSFLCPLMQKNGKDLYITYLSSGQHYKEYIGGSELEVLEREKGLVRIIRFENFEHEFFFEATIILSLGVSPNQKQFLSLEKIIAEFFNKLLRTIFSEIRRTIIQANSSSNDINSFLYKVFRHPCNLIDILGAEAGSIFLRSPRSAMLKLRGTTGLATGGSIRDIAFHKDQNTNVAKVYRNNKPISQHGSNYPISEGTSAEYVKQPVRTKIYFPIRLRQSSVSTANPKSPRLPIGVLRLVNSNSLSKGSIPFSWIYVNIIQYCSESMFNVLSSYFLAEEQSFKKDEAFHGASGAVDTIIKNINYTRRYIFDDIEPVDPTIPHMFSLQSKDNASYNKVHKIKLLLNTAYANARSLSFQIERANIELPENKDAVTEKLIGDVILRAEGTLRDICTMHSAEEYLDVESAKTIMDNANYPRPVKGDAAALTSVFVNLYENSVKYRKFDEPIKIRLKFEQTPTHFIIRFRDSGIGIKEGEEQIIFDRGLRTECARSHVMNGIGLGLAHCKEIINHYGGEIEAHRLENGLEIAIKLQTN